MRLVVRILTPSLADGWFVGLFLVVALALGGLLLGDGDTGYHVRTGEQILATGSVPTSDIFSFHQPPLPWLAHEWLAEVVMALAHRAAGLTGVVILYALLLALTFTLVFRYLLLPHGDVVAAFAVGALATVTSMLHWLARPHVFTLLFFVVTMLVLERQRRSHTRLLYLLPLLMVPWVNLHGGFISAFLLLGTYGVDSLLQLAGASPPQRPAARQQVKALALVSGCCLLATLLNPRGYLILLFPLRLAADKFVVDNVQEFLSPDFHHQMVFLIYLTLVLALLAISRSRLGFVETVLFGGCLCMALFSVRYAPLFAIVSAPALLRLLTGLPGTRWQALLRRSRDWSADLVAISQRAAGHLWPATAVVAVGLLVATHQLQHRFNARTMPIAAVEFLIENHVVGQPFNDDEFGDYLIYAAWPRYRVFFDGRGDMYGAGRMRDYLHITRVDSNFDRVVAKYGVSWFFVRAESTVAQYLRLRPDWRPIYSDPVATVFVKGAPGDHPAPQGSDERDPSGGS